MWEEPNTTLDEGPCNSDVGVRILCDCNVSIQELRSHHAPVNPAGDLSSTEALLWLKDCASDIDCTRLLLRAKRILWDDPADFHLEYGLYWDACGKLLGELAARKDLPGISAILLEIQERFRIEAERPWAARRYVIACLAEFGTHCAVSFAAPDRNNFQLFWDTLAYCLAHCRAAFDCLTTHNLRVHDDLTQSVACLIDLWFRLTSSLIREAQETAGDVAATVHCQTQVNLMNQGIPLLELGLNAKLVRTESLSNWKQTVHALIRHVNWESQRDEMKEAFRRIIHAMDDGWSKLTDQLERDAYRDIRDELLPELQGRMARRRRKVC